MLTLELYTFGLPPEQRELLLDYLYDAQGLVPGGVSSDGRFELKLNLQEYDLARAPLLQANDRVFEQLSLQALKALVPTKRRP
jgi:hypothetical protein